MGGLARAGWSESGGKDIGRGEDVAAGEGKAGSEAVAGEEWSGAGKETGAREGDAIEDRRTCVVENG